MSEVEIGAAMAAAEVTNDTPTAPEVAAPAAPAEPVVPTVNETTDDQAGTFVNAADCTKVYDYVMNNRGIIRNWKPVTLALEDGTAVSDTQEVLVGVDEKNVPFSFSCKNLMVPNTVVQGATDIKVLVSGIIIYTPTASVYISKNNIFVYTKSADGHTSASVVYYKVRGGKVSYKVYDVEANDARGTAEFAKLQFKIAGGRIYNIIQSMTDVAEIRTAILTFLREKVVDINYSIKIENICYTCGF